MKCPDEVKRLVEKFYNNLELYKSSKHDETATRIEFIDPLFSELGWDINNSVNNLAPGSREVEHEYKIKIEGKAKAPDYCFQISKTPKFYLEAKRPSVSIDTDKAPAYQLRRYAWSKGLPVSILTDFEEFAVYDCNYKPEETHEASYARTKFITYDQYEDKWEEIHGLFSREAVKGGSLDQFLKPKKKKGVVSVDDAFLGEIEQWRVLLANEIWTKNNSLTIRELNDAVQRTIDRIIFLRICEDRGIEPYENLRKTPKKGGAYEHLKGLFHKADEYYNSGLFHFREETGRNTSNDSWMLNLDIGDKPVEDILERLYFPHSPYEFSVFPADMLGKVYEQFLGKVIHLEDNKVEIQEKPEVKKAGGVYYTPTYIVDYIVKNTIGKQLEGLTPEQAMGKGRGELHKHPIRVVDPSCGSGSFLIGAYQFLLDWYLGQYNDNPEKYLKGKSPRIFEFGSSVRLTTSERKRILLDHIYGVDIDSQAIEVTKLSLLLKVLEGENKESIGSQPLLFKQRVLPDLANNIKCGNSLIGRDVYENTQLDLLDRELKYRINAFNWQEGFKEVFSGEDQGFDAVIGNPPYVRQEGLSEFKEYFEGNYKVYHGVADLYTYFIEKGITMLNQHGVFGYIIMNKWLRANYGRPLREWLIPKGIQQVIDFGDLPVFKGATTYPCILIVKKNLDLKEFQVSPLTTLDFPSLTEHVDERVHLVPFSVLNSDGWTLTNEKKRMILDKVNVVGVSLKEYVDGGIYRGVVTGLNKVFVIDQVTRDRLIGEDEKSEELIKPFALGRDVKRYEEWRPKQYLIFTRRGTDIEKYPAIEMYLTEFKDSLMPKPNNWLSESSWKGRKSGKYEWFENQDTTNYYREFEKEKIIFAEIAIRGQFILDKESTYSDSTTYIMSSNSRYFLGVLNSSLFTFILTSISSSIRGGFYRWKRQYVEKMPIHTINFDDPEEVSKHDKVVSFVETILSLKKELSEAKSSHNRTLLKREIEATDAQIDQLVYNLYGLTEEEIKIVEESVN